MQACTCAQSVQDRLFDRCLIAHLRCKLRNFCCRSFPRAPQHFTKAWRTADFNGFSRASARADADRIPTWIYAMKSPGKKWEKLLRDCAWAVFVDNCPQFFCDRNWVGGANIEEKCINAQWWWWLRKGVSSAEEGKAILATGLHLMFESWAWPKKRQEVLAHRTPGAASNLVIQEDFLTLLDFWQTCSDWWSCCALFIIDIAEVHWHSGPQHLLKWTQWLPELRPASLKTPRIWPSLKFAREWVAQLHIASHSELHVFNPRLPVGLRAWPEAWKKIGNLSH